MLPAVAQALGLDGLETPEERLGGIRFRPGGPDQIVAEQNGAGENSGQALEPARHIDGVAKDREFKTAFVSDVPKDLPPCSKTTCATRPWNSRRSAIYSLGEEPSANFVNPTISAKRTPTSCSRAPSNG